MNVSSKDDASSLRGAAVEFAVSLNAGLHDRDKEGVFDHDLWRRCAEFGVLGLPIPARYGGSEQDLPTTVRVLEGLGYGCRDNGLLFGLMAQLWSVELPILLFGTEDQRARYLPGLVDGSIIGAHAVTEPEAGSDVFSLRTSAQLDGDTYRLNGTKVFITSAPVADVFLIVATVDVAAGVSGLTAFLVDRSTPGISVTTPDEKMGLRTSAMGELTLSDVCVPATQVLGRVGGGSAVFGTAMEWERSYILAPALGTMRRQLEGVQALRPVENAVRRADREARARRWRSSWTCSSASRCCSFSSTGPHIARKSPAVGSRMSPRR